MSLCRRLLMLLAFLAFLTSCASTGSEEEFVYEDEPPIISDDATETVIDNNEQYVQEQQDTGVVQDVQLHDTTIYFAFDSSLLNQDSINTLNTMINPLLANTQNNPNYIIRLNGHTDERGTREYNNLLGLRRANSVSRYLRVNSIPAINIITKSYGEERPVALGSNEQAWRLNRRVEIILPKQQ